MVRVGVTATAVLWLAAPELLAFLAVTVLTLAFMVTLVLVINESRR